RPGAASLVEQRALPLLRRALASALRRLATLVQAGDRPAGDDRVRVRGPRDCERGLVAGDRRPHRRRRPARTSARALGAAPKQPVVGRRLGLLRADRRGTGADARPWLVARRHLDPHVLSGRVRLGEQARRAGGRCDSADPAGDAARRDHERAPGRDLRHLARGDRLSAPPGNTCPLLARDHAAPGTTLALAKATSLGRGRVPPLAWCSRPRSQAALPEGALVPRANATFVNATYDEEAYDDRDGVVLGRIRITRTFAGELEGESSAELLTARMETGSATYVALDRVAGRLGGRSGSFVLAHHGTVSGAGAETAASVVPDSATAELKGLRGRGSISVAEDGTHTLTLEYEFDR